MYAGQLVAGILLSICLCSWGPDSRARLVVQRGQAASGFIVSADGTLVTNAHILEDLLDPRSPPSEPLRGACAVTVTLQDGRVFQGRIANLDRWRLQC